MSGRRAAGVAGRVLAPATPDVFVERPRLLELLDWIERRRLTTLIAGAGFGKSALLAGWARGRRVAWVGASERERSLEAFAAAVVDSLRLRAPGLDSDLGVLLGGVRGPDAGTDSERAVACASLLTRALEERLTRDLVLVVDDFEEVTASEPVARLVEALVLQAPSRLHVAICSRSPLPFAVGRLRAQGQLLELGGAELAFSPAETAALVREVAGPIGDDDVAAIQRSTAGWPAAVRLAVEAMRSAPAGERTLVVARLQRPGGSIFDFLAEEVFAREPEAVQKLLGAVAPLERFTAALCAALGLPDAEAILPALAGRGLFVELHGDIAGWYSLAPPIREFMRARPDARRSDGRSVRRRAARWLEEHGGALDALALAVTDRDGPTIVRLLHRHGARLLAEGGGNAILEAAGALTPEASDADVEALVGEALQATGDWDAALARFERSTALAGGITPGLAWRMGLIHHLRGRLDEALAVYSAGAAAGGEPRDVALTLAWRSAAHWLRGDGEALRNDAARAVALAGEAGDDQALAAAHTALAMLAAFDGDRGANDLHYLQALDHAKRAGDVLQLIRIRTNRGSRHLEEGGFAEAIAELDIALELADVAGFQSFRGLALTNRGDALYRLGRLEEAVADLEAARTLYEHQGSQMVAYPLEKLAEVYAERGRNTQAAACYTAAVEHAEAAGDLQGLVPALSGLARLRAREGVPEASELAARARSFEYGMAHVRAVVADGWVALASGETGRAAAAAEEAASFAAVRRDRVGLAEALELAALAADAPVRASDHLREAVALWSDLGVPVGVARASLALALVAHDEPATRACESELRALGVRDFRLQLDEILRRTTGVPLSVQTLGRFRVLRGGEPVGVTEWQSRKARDLLKLLVARRGKPGPRDVFMDLLWPGEPAGRLGGRLSVVLSTLRSVLDPAKAHPSDHFVGADKASLWLQRETVDVDVERFLAAAAGALSATRRGASDAGVLLAEAEQAYVGDFLEEDLYEDWAVGLREEARTTYVDVARSLARHAGRTGDADVAARLYRRILERDGYDEGAHLALVGTLVSAGRHGEARRCYQAYCARMEEIGVAAALFPESPPEGH
ncbi:MAG: BTAD domain-containing putative transcriptional regulator [Gaiellales bacterium]